MGGGGCGDCAGRIAQPPPELKRQDRAQPPPERLAAVPTKGSIPRPVDGLGPRGLVEIDDRPLDDDDRALLHHPSQAGERPQRILDVVIDACEDDDIEVGDAKPIDVVYRQLWVILDLGIEDLMDELESRLPREIAVRDEVGGVDFCRPAPLSQEGVQAVPAADVEDFLAPEVNLIDCLLERGVAAAPYPGRHDTVAEIDAVDPLVLLDLPEEFVPGLLLRSRHVILHAYGMNLR